MTDPLSDIARWPDTATWDDAAAWNDDPDTAMTPSQVADAAVASIAAAFPDLTVDLYREDRRNLQLPACLVSLIDMEPGDDIDAGTGQLPLMLRFEAHLVVGMRSPRAQIEAPNIAASVAYHIKRNRWGLAIGPAAVTLVAPDEFAPELDQYVVWRVDWQQVIDIGKSVWTNDGVLPRIVISLIGDDETQVSP